MPVARGAAEFSVLATLEMIRPNAMKTHDANMAMMPSSIQVIGLPGPTSTSNIAVANRSIT